MIWIAAVGLGGFVAAATLTLVALVAGAPDPCALPRLPSGVEGLGTGALVLAFVGLAGATVITVVVVALFATGHRLAGLALAAVATGIVVGALVAGEINATREREATPQHCRVLAGPPTEPIEGHAEIELSIETAPFAGRAAGSGICVLPPDQAGTSWLNASDGGPVDWPIGAWYVYGAEIVGRGSDLPTPLYEDDVGLPADVIERSPADYWLLLTLGQPGHSVVYGALGGDSWTVDESTAGGKRQISFALPELPELGGSTPAGLPGEISGSLAWRCDRIDPWQ